MAVDLGLRPAVLSVGPSERGPQEWRDPENERSRDYRSTRRQMAMVKILPSKGEIANLPRIAQKRNGQIWTTPNPLEKNILTKSSGGSQSKIL